jgi:DnaJ-class molecular chaperone
MTKVNSVTVTCAYCKATGRDPDDEQEICPVCKGTGYVEVVPDKNGEPVKCSSCRGLGRTEEVGDCSACGGSGWANRAK